MKNRKRLQDLTIKDNFMFAAVMMQEENCRIFLEMALGFQIKRVEVSYEKSIIYNPEYKGVRLDVFASDEKNTHYNVEMQVVRQHPGKRSRYYHSQMDMELLVSGTPYELLSDVYVIFICDYDPFGREKYRYTFNAKCEEDTGLSMEDGSHSVFLSTKGKNELEVPEELVKFLRFVESDLENSTNDYEDEFVARLQASIRHIKESRKMGERYMIFEEMLREEFTQGKEEGVIEAMVSMIIELLETLGDIPDELRNSIIAEKDISTLKRLHILAAKAESIDEFLQKK